MTSDLVLHTVSVVLTIGTAAVGIEMANNPPTSSRGKWGYRAVFAALAVLLIGVDVWQYYQSQKEQTQLRDAGTAAQKVSDERNNQLQGKLDTLTTLVSHPPPGLTREQLTETVRSIVRPLPARNNPYDSMSHQTLTYISKDKLMNVMNARQAQTYWHIRQEDRSSVSKTDEERKKIYSEKEPKELAANIQTAIRELCEVRLAIVKKYGSDENTDDLARYACSN